MFEHNCEFSTFSEHLCLITKSCRAKLQAIVLQSTYETTHAGSMRDRSPLQISPRAQLRLSLYMVTYSNNSRHVNRLELAWK